jgi:L-amino acid N-acyltransferase YncA
VTQLAYTIRPATPNDAAAIAEIWLEGLQQNLVRVERNMSLAEAQAAFAERLRLAVDPFGFWVATAADGRLLGWQSTLPNVNNPLLRDRCAEASTYVRPLASHAGVGEALLRHGMAQAKGSRLNHLVGWIVNPLALRMVERCGWATVGLLPETVRVSEAERWHLVAWAVPHT